MPPVFSDECDGCGRCAETCTMDVIRVEEGRPRAAYPDECWHCGICAMECPRGAVRVDFPLPARPVTRRVKP